MDAVAVKTLKEFRKQTCGPTIDGLNRVTLLK